LVKLADAGWLKLFRKDGWLVSKLRSMKEKQEWGGQIEFLNTIFLPLLLFTFLQLNNMKFVNW